MAKYSFISYSNTPIKVEEMDKLLIIYTYKQRMANFIHFSINALTITLVTLLLTIIISISEILNIGVFSLYLALIDYLSASIGMAAIGFFVYLALLIWLIRELYRKIKLILQGYKDKFYSGQQPYLLDIFKEKAQKEDAIQIQSVIEDINPIDYRIHDFEKIIAMN